MNADTNGQSLPCDMEFQNICLLLMIKFDISPPRLTSFLFLLRFACLLSLCSTFSSQFQKNKNSISIEIMQTLNIHLRWQDRSQSVLFSQCDVIQCLNHIVPEKSTLCTDRYCMLGRFANAFLNIFSLLLRDGGMGCWTFIRHEEPEAIPHDPKTSWRERGRQAEKG